MTEWASIYSKVDGICIIRRKWEGPRGEPLTPLMLDTDVSDPAGDFRVYLDPENYEPLHVSISLDEEGVPRALHADFNMLLIGPPTLWPYGPGSFTWLCEEDLWGDNLIYPSEWMPAETRMF